MKIVMGVKYAPEQYGSRSFTVELTPEDIGLLQPKSEEEFKSLLKELQFRGKHACELFLLKDGWHDKDQVVESLRAYRQ